jgi:hypothetical protein
VNLGHVVVLVVAGTALLVGCAAAAIVLAGHPDERPDLDDLTDDPPVWVEEWDDFVEAHPFVERARRRWLW